MIRVFDTVGALNEAAANMMLCEMMRPQPGLVGLATGTTTTPIHQQLVRLIGEAPFDLSALEIAAVDDYVGIEVGHIASCAERIRRQLAVPLGLGDGQVLLPDQFSGDPHGYEKQITRRGGIRFQVLGMGSDGHIGFNYPGTPISSVAHLVDLPQKTKDTLSRLYQLPEASMPRYGLTLGIKSILRAGRILVVATGAGKAGAVKAALNGLVDEDVPASALQLHPDVTWYLDREAAAGL